MDGLSPYLERAGAAGRWTPIAGAMALWGVGMVPELPVCLRVVRMGGTSGS